MARLQRKKGPDVKKKRTKDAEGEPSNLKDGSTLDNTSSTAVTVREAKKPQTFPSKKVASGPRAEPGKIRGSIDKSLQFLREVRVELKKVAWPSRKQTLGSTAVVLILVLIISLFLGAADIGLSSLIAVVLN